MAEKQSDDMIEHTTNPNNPINPFIPVQTKKLNKVLMYKSATQPMIINELKDWTII